MSRYTGPKARICRREGVNLFGPEKYQKILQNRPGTPGVHGASLRKKKTQYGSQLREKQKARYLFGVTEKQMSNYFKKAASMTGDTGEQLMTLLERRLDNVIYRSGFTRTRFQSRQFVNHGHVYVNGDLVTIPSAQVKEGDVISFHEKIKKTPVFKMVSDKQKAPKWLVVNKKDFTFTIDSLPKQDEFDALIEVHLIVEFYSR